MRAGTAAGIYNLRRLQDGASPGSTGGPAPRLLLPGDFYLVFGQIWAETGLIENQGAGRPAPEGTVSHITPLSDGLRPSGRGVTPATMAPEAPCPAP